LLGRLQALGPVVMSDPRLPALEARGLVFRVTWNGHEAWCERRLFQRIHRYTVDRRRQQTVAVSLRAYWRFLCAWQHAAPGFRLQGPQGVQAVIDQLAGYGIPLKAWEKNVLPQRVDGYRPEWLDQLMLSGQVVWGRLWGAGHCSLSALPVVMVPRSDLQQWFSLLPPLERPPLSGYARVIDKILESRGAVFSDELRALSDLLPEHFESGLCELIVLGRVTADSFAGLRQLLRPSSRRRGPLRSVGRWSLLGPHEGAEPEEAFVADQLLKRWGVLCRRVVLREKIPFSWRDILKICRQWEWSGRVYGGRFVGGLSGEQFALPEAVSLLRRVAREDLVQDLTVAAADPLNLDGILTNEAKISPQSLMRVGVKNGS